jgi:outer membrane protein
MKIFNIIIICIIIFSTTLLSDNKNNNIYELSLQEAIELSLQNNLDIIISNYRIDITNYDIEKRKASFDPAITSSLTIQDDDRKDISAGIRKLFQIGSDVSIQHSLNQSEISSLGESYTSSLSLTFRQPLLKNRGKNINLTNLRIEYNNQKISELNLKNQILSTLENIQNIYWNIVYYNELFTVKKQTLNLAKELYENNKVKVELGLLPQIELTRAAASVASQQEGIIISENNIYNAQDILLNYLNAFDNPLFKNKIMKPIDEPEPILLIPDFYESMNFCFENNPDYLKMKKNIENNNIRLEYYNNQKLPSLDFVSSVTANGIDADLGSSYSDLSNFDNRNWQVSLNLSFPLGNRSSKTDYKSAELNKITLLAELKKLENTLTLQIQQAIRNIEVSIKRIDAAKTSVKLAEENLKSEMERYELQQTTTFNVLQEQEKLDNEKTRLLKAIIDNQIAVVEYESLVGGKIE